MTFSPRRNSLDTEVEDVEDHATELQHTGFQHPGPQLHQALQSLRGEASTALLTWEAAVVQRLGLRWSQSRIIKFIGPIHSPFSLLAAGPVARGGPY